MMEELIAIFLEPKEMQSLVNQTKEAYSALGPMTLNVPNLKNLIWF